MSYFALASRAVHHRKGKFTSRVQKSLHAGQAFLYFAPSAVSGVNHQEAGFGGVSSTPLGHLRVQLFFCFGEGATWLFLHAKERLSK
jgi:hypothetical protein